jgi:hypothetical protein
MKPKLKNRAPRAVAHKEEKGECVIPPAMPHEALAGYVLKVDNDEAKRIRSYVEREARGETVKHMEKITSESIFCQQMDGWDVRTDKNRWWVITHPTNLYSQELFPSLDYTFSFHVGVVTRMQQRDMSEEQEHAHDHINQLWNRLARANATLFSAKKGEDFQSVGMKCRECLLFLSETVALPEMVPKGQETPQRGNFIAWCELIANHLAPGGGNERLRSYLKDIAKSTWQLVNWLTHAQGAGLFDGSVATGATENVLQSFITAWARSEAPKHEAKRKLPIENRAKSDKKKRK